MNNYASAVITANNNNYIPQGGGGGIGDANLYCDTTPIKCPGTYHVSAVKLVQPGNRIAIAIGYYDDENKLHWLWNTDNNGDYWHISKNETYASTAVIKIPQNKICQGIRFIQSGNQLGYQVFIANSDGTQGEWKNPDNHDSYIEGSLEGTYMDTNKVILPKYIKPTGFQIWNKKNRIAPSLLV